MVDLGSLVLLMSIFGWKVAVVYVVLGLVIAVAGGTLIEKLHLENQVEEYIRNGRSLDVPQEELHFKDLNTVCLGAGGIDRQKGCSLCSDWCGYWCLHS